MRVRVLTKILLALFFLFQPMVVYLTSYEVGDCDDKAVHYYSSVYFVASEEKKKEFNNTIWGYVDSRRGEKNWERTDFRLKAASNYPLANSLIFLFTNDSWHFADSVKAGLFVVTFLSLIALVVVSSVTLFGYWQGVLLANLVAFSPLMFGSITSLVPSSIHPFITYVPRGSLALLVVVPIISISSGKKWLFIISLGLMFLWHSVMALALTVMLLLAVLISIRSFGKPDNIRFYKNFLNVSLTFMLILIFVTLALSNVVIKDALVRVTGIPAMMFYSKRLHGPIFVVLITVFLVFLRLFVAKRHVKLIELKRILSIRIRKKTVILAVLLIITLIHLPKYVEVVSGRAVFFTPDCRETEELRLPDDMSRLSMSDEPSFFLSVARLLR